MKEVEISGRGGKKYRRLVGEAETGEESKAESRTGEEESLKPVEERRKEVQEISGRG